MIDQDQAGPSVGSGRGRWEFILSHHLDDQYGHTFGFGKIRVCGRCSAIVVGAVVSIISWPNLPTPVSLVPLWGGLLLPLPAMFGYLAGKLSDFHVDLKQRAITGFLQGAAVGFAIDKLIEHRFLEAALQFAWIVLLLITVLCLLIAKGKLRPMMEQIEQGIGK